MRQKSIWYKQIREIFSENESEEIQDDVGPNGKNSDLKCSFHTITREKKRKIGSRRPGCHGETFGS